MTSRSLALALAFALGGAAACSKPEPPQITPKDVTVVGLDPNGATLRVRVDAYNPNSVALPIRGVTGRVLLDGKEDLGVVNASSPVSLPPHAHQLVTVSLTTRWASVATLGAAAAASRSLPYVVDGTVDLGGNLVDVHVPFRLEGTISRDEAIRAAARALPRLPVPLPLPK